MKNKILISVAILLILVVIGVRYEFNEKFEVFKTSISQYKTAQLETFRKEKENRIALLSNGDKKILQLFTEQFDESKAITERDTSFSFIYLSDKVKYKTASMKYLDCLNAKCINDQQNETNQKLIKAKENELEKRYGKTYLLWFSKFKDEKLLKKTNKIDECSNYFPDLYEVFYDANVWKDFEKFMYAYNSETREMQIQNKKTENQFASNVEITKNQLRSEVLNYFDDQLSNKKSQIIATEAETKTYSSPTLGLITYTINKTSFDKQAFQVVADDAFQEQWKNNSLSTGATPYFYCYGASNYCNSYGCSRITVLTGGSDVLVIIKDIKEDVVRHGYINGGNSFSFNVPDGQYEVFFYSGNGWNPNKVMPSTSCGILKGGFVSGESVTKVDYRSLNNNVWTIELILQENGNLETQSSSKSEAF
jgi:hypothetical protein